MRCPLPARFSSLSLLPVLLFSTHALLQGQALMVGPTSVEFRMQSGASTTQQQSVMVLGNQTTSPLVSVTVTNASWLTTPESSVTIPRRVTLIANPAGLPPGTYTGNVLLQNAGAPPVLLPVSLTISPFSQLAVSRGSLQFVYHLAGGKGTSLTDPTGAFLHTSSDQIIVTSSGNPVSYTATTSTADGANWLIASPTTGITPDSLGVRIAPAGLAAGNYSGTIALQSAAGGAPVNISVSLVVVSSPYLTSSPSAINLFAYAGTVAPVTQPLVLDSSGIVSYVIFTSTTSGGPWLTVTPASANAPATVTVSANAGGLGPGTYNGALLISSASSANPAVTIPVTLTVTLSAVLALSKDVLNFDFKVGDRDSSAPQTINVTSIPPGANYAVKASSPTGGSWFSVGPISGQTAGGTPTGTVPAGAVSVQATPDPNMLPGTYFANVDVTGAANTASARLILTVSNPSSLRLSPADVTFNIQRPSAFQAVKEVQVTSSAAPLPFAAGAIVYTPASGAWLRAVTSATVTPGKVQLSLDPAVATALPDGTYTATVALDSSTRINVTLNLSANRLLELSPPELFFNAPIGATPPPFQSLSATTTDNSALNVTVSTSGEPWLLVASSGTTPANLTVGVNPFGLPIGRYEGTVTVSATGANPPPAQRSRVILVVPPSASLAASPASLRFTKTVTGADPTAQPVSISSSGGPAVAYSIAASTADGRAWLQVIPAGGITPGVLTVSVNSAGLPPGNYSGAVAVSSPDAANSPLLIPVSFSVAPASFTAAPAVLNFGAPAGSAAAVTQQLQVAATPSGAIPFTATTSQPWITVTPAGATTPAALTVSLNPAGMAAGVHSATITLTASQAQAAPINIPVNVVIGPPATLVVSPTVLSLTLLRGANPQSTNFSITTTAASTPITVEARTTSGGTWLTVNPATGLASPLLTLAAVVDPTGLNPGSYAGSIVISGANVLNSPVTVPVTMNVSAGRQILSQLADGENWQTTITLVNMENTPAAYTLRFYDQNGAPLRLPIEGNPGRLEAYEGLIPGGGSRTIRTAGTDAALSQGWAELETVRQIAGLGIFRQRVTGRPDLEAAVAVTNPASRFLLAFDNLQNYTTSFALVNTSSIQSRGLNIAARMENGSSLFLDTINLPPRGQTAVESNRRFPATANLRGVLDMTSAGDFTGLGLRFNPTGAFTSFPVLTVPPAPVPNQLLSQLADGGAGGEWQTTITLVNLDTQAAPYSLRFWAPNGAPLPVPVTGLAAPVTTLDNTIPAGGVQTITTQGGATPLITGWTELVSSRAVGSIAVFRQRVAGRADYEAAVTATASGRAFVLPFENTESFITSMALVNTNSNTPASVVVNLRDESGTAIANDTIVLAPRGQTAFRLVDRFPQLVNRRGVAEFTSTGGEISGLGLRFNPTGAFTSLPATPR